jgi:hypothetical protein
VIRPWCVKHDCEVLGFVDQMPLEQYFDTAFGFDFVRRVIIRGVRYGCALSPDDEATRLPEVEPCDPSDWRLTDGGGSDVHSP